jgi:Family of unknown function (DUF6112)
LCCLLDCWPLSVALDSALPRVVPVGGYALRRWDQPAWRTRRAINMFVSDVNIQPNRTGLPGIASLESIVGAPLTFGLVAAVAGIAISAIAWAIGSHSGNPHVAGKGKSGVQNSRLRHSHPAVVDACRGQEVIDQGGQVVGLAVDSCDVLAPVLLAELVPALCQERGESHDRRQGGA